MPDVLNAEITVRRVRSVTNLQIVYEDGTRKIQCSACGAERQPYPTFRANYPMLLHDLARHVIPRKLQKAGSVLGSALMIGMNLGGLGDVSRRSDSSE